MSARPSMQRWNGLLAQYRDNWNSRGGVSHTTMRTRRRGDGQSPERNLGAEAPLYLRKECDPYDLGEQRLMIAKHRIPTEDVVSPTCFPDRGRALTWPSKCRFECTRGQGMKMPPATA